MRLDIIVVLYNKEFQSSNTLLSLISQENIPSSIDINLFLYDNSERSMINKEDLDLLNELFNVKYISDGNNRTLNEIYTHHFKHKFKDDSVHYFLILDDDSLLSKTYLINWYESYFSSVIIKKRLPVFIPQVIVNEVQYSPFKMCRFLSFKFDGIASKAFKDVGAINSGLFIPNVGEINNFNYPDYLKFYGTDMVFFDYLNKINYDLIVMDDNVIVHDLSFDKNKSEDEYISRLLIVVEFWKLYYTGFFDSFLLKLYLKVLSLRLSLRYRKKIIL
ncbi:hypothetical protein ACMVZU_001489 [Vibrio parahaemolyticus]|nr:hypothetical protein [Vibrio parahaemolyticus]EGQ8924825.1 hypothetical protein [Vibrio parahaemolyticus]EHH2549502.1 hypothetical protein [Vibrio parahaemolyticus]EHH3638215.1 hypothetical protein [Vibrio parahaemolyticus]EHZ2728776.1 hypothetical protein [Vibrio parahaemolyticus]EIA1582913.1 hypothetical protein [Vibrio parahaemolyticus]